MAMGSPPHFLEGTFLRKMQIHGVFLLPSSFGAYGVSIIMPSVLDVHPTFLNLVTLLPCKLLFYLCIY